jgi:homoserine kinase
MTVRALVRIPGAVTVSVAIDDGFAGATKITRTGTLADFHVDVAEDPVVAGFRWACLRAGKSPPQLLEVRAHSEIPLAIGHGGGPLAAAHHAGVVAANALLGLGLENGADVQVSVHRECEPEQVPEPKAESRLRRELRLALSSAAFAFTGIPPR